MFNTLYKGMMASPPLRWSGCLTVLVRRNTKTTIDGGTIKSHDPKPLGGKSSVKPVITFGPLIVLCMLPREALAWSSG